MKYGVYFFQSLVVVCFALDYQLSIKERNNPCVHYHAVSFLGTGAQVLSTSASNRAPSTSPLKIIRMTQNKASSEPVLIKDEPGDDGMSTGQKSPLPIETSGAKIHCMENYYLIETLFWIFQRPFLIFFR